MNKIKHTEFDADDYSSMPIFFKIKYTTDDPILKEIFKDDLELLNQIKWIALVASQEIENINDWQDLDNFNTIKNRIKRKRKSAWFFAFIRFQCIDFRGYVAERACSAHSFKKYISGRDFKNMMSEVKNSIRQINDNLSNKE